MVIDHIGVVVSSIEEGIRHWEEFFGYRLNSDIVQNTRQKVRVAFLYKKDSLPIKLIEPSAPDSPIAAFARRGGGLHHLCFRCDDLQAQTSELASKGARFLVHAEPGEAFLNHDISFFLTKQSLNIELIDTLEKAGWKDPGASS